MSLMFSHHQLLQNHSNLYCAFCNWWHNIHFLPIHYEPYFLLPLHSLIPISELKKSHQGPPHITPDSSDQFNIKHLYEQCIWKIYEHTNQKFAMKVIKIQMEVYQCIRNTILDDYSWRIMWYYCKKIREKKLHDYFRGAHTPSWYENSKVNF